MQQLEPDTECLSNLELDEWLADELDTRGRRRCELHFAQCEHCRARRAQRELEAARFYAEAPHFDATQARARRGQVLTSLPLRASGTRRWSVALLGSALAACVALAVFRGDVRESTRTKGSVHLGYFVKRGAQVFRGDADTRVYPDDLVRFVYAAPRGYYLAVFCVDARTTSVYFPGGAMARARAVAPGQDVALDFSVELDAQLGPERVIGFFCSEAFEVEPVRSALASGAPLPAAMERCESAQLTLRKQAEP
jgi:hypothetical protein